MARRRWAALAVVAGLAAGVGACGGGGDRTAEPVTDTNPAVNIDPSGTIGGRDPDTNLPVTQTTTVQTTPTDTADSGGTEAPAETTTTTVDGGDSGGADAGGAGSGGADADSAVTVPSAPEPTGGGEAP